MKPVAFGYVRPASVAEACAHLEADENARVLAGGQSLIPLMKLRFASPGHLVDVNRVAGLDAIEERDGRLRLGALVRHNQLAGSDVITSRYPTIAAAAPQIADPLVRNLGTIGGSLAHADPSGDLGSVMLAPPEVTMEPFTVTATPSAGAAEAVRTRATLPPALPP